MRNKASSKSLTQSLTPNSLTWLSLCFSLFDSKFTAIVTTFSTNCVINVGCATVRANCQCRQYCYIMCTTLSGSGVRLSSFRMCHIIVTFIVLYYFVMPPDFGFIRQHLLQYKDEFGEVPPSEDYTHPHGDDVLSEDLSLSVHKTTNPNPTLRLADQRKHPHH